MKIRGNTVGTTLKPKKVIVKATDLTEEQKAQARYNIGAVDKKTVDAISVALEYAMTLLLNKVSYYSTVGAAVNDVNAGTIGTNANATKDDAVAAVCMVDGKPFVALLKDTTEATRLKPAVDMTINLGGHTLSANDACCFAVDGGTLTIDGRMAGSTIVMNRTTNAVIAQIPANKGNIVVNGGTYSVYADNGGTICAFYLLTGNNGTFTDCTIIAESNTTTAKAISGGANMTITNSKITAKSANEKAHGAIISGDVTISDCDIRAYSNYLGKEDGTGFASSSVGVNNTGTLTIKDCYVYGTHSGMQNNGTVYVDGGIYESYGHGGIYFSGEGTTSYCCNAILRDCDAPDGYNCTHQRNGAGFYIGSDSNVSVYMDNCYIWGYNASQVIAMRNTSGEQNNTLYISNSRIDKGAKIRIDDGGHKVYIGHGNNFTAEDTTKPHMVVVTDEVYVQAS